VLLVAHGSRDPRAAGVVAALARAVRHQLAADRTGERVAVAHLDFTEPSVGTALRELASGGATEVVVVPLLFAPGYHLRVDLPAAVAEVRAGRPDLVVSIAEPLGAEPDAGAPDLLLDALTARLPEPVRRYDALVLASVGSAEPLSRQAVEAVASRWSRRLGRPVTSAFATGVGSRVDVAVARLRAQGAERVAVSGLFLAPGRLPEAVRRTAIEAGASVAEPLGADPRLVQLVARRANRANAHALLTH
jgi:sirohydrochlorin ferrochelatase